MIEYFKEPINVNSDIRSYIKVVDYKRKKEMSKDQKRETVYLKGSAKEVTFGNGGSIINLSINVPQLIQIHEWYNKERTKLGLDETDYIRLDVKSRREKGEYGDTHYVSFDPWFPEPKKSKGSSNDLPF